MLSAFILRFQENCVVDPSPAVRSSTKTITAVRAEQIDDDPKRSAYTALPEQQSLEAGTETMTRVQREHTDADRDLSDLAVIPPQQAGPTLGTQTATYVRAEKGDKDPGQHRLQAIPHALHPDE